MQTGIKLILVFISLGFVYLRQTGNQQKTVILLRLSAITSLQSALKADNKMFRSTSLHISIFIF